MATGLLLAALVLPPMAVPAAEGEAAVALPPFIVEELAKGPPWRYAQAPGYEILSRCNDSTTQRVVESHFRLHELLAEIVPARLRLELAEPRSLILYDEELQPAASQEVIRQLLRTQPGVPEEDPAPSPGRGFRLSPPAQRYNFLPNLRLWDLDAMSVFMIVRRDEFEADRLSLTQDYVNFVLRRRLPALPAWFVTGILEVHAHAAYRRGELAIEPLEWISGPLTSVLKDDPKQAPGLQALEPFLAAQLPALAEGQTHDPVRAWQSQAGLLVRWGLDADKGAHREALWRFAEQAAQRPAGEAEFTACFGFGYAEARERLAAYLPAAVRRTLYLRPAQRTKFPALVLTNASDGQIARLKGDWERLEVPYVRAISADLAPKYLDQARRTLRRAYDRDQRDPRLLAVMGLCEVDAGNGVAARDFLEAARQGGPIRPRANYELARLRLGALRSAPSRKEPRLTVAEMTEVLQPLFDARAAAPPLVEVYELIAEAWSLSLSPPTRGHLAVLDEGVRLFPRRIELVTRTAELYARHGFREEARVMLDWAERLPIDPATAPRLAALRLEIGAEAPGQR